MNTTQGLSPDEERELERHLRETGEEEAADDIRRKPVWTPSKTFLRAAARHRRRLGTYCPHRW